MTVIGAGLLGASLLQAAHTRKICKRTVVWSRRVESRESCRKAPWCDYAPDNLADAAQKGEIEKRRICRTFSDCTTAPRNGLPSGCFPLDDYYKKGEYAAAVKALKKTSCNPV